MSLPPLYAVVDPESCARAGRAPLDVAQAFLEAGVLLLQVRAKTSSTREFLELATAVVSRAGHRARVIVNDRADVARLANAGGVHLGQDDLPVVDARRLLGPDRLVGYSTHSTTQARTALDQPVSYLAIGPVFSTRTKETGYEPVGLSLVAEVADLARSRGVPLVAIGGITLETAPAVIAAGATSVCVISDLLVGDPYERADAYVNALR